MRLATYIASSLLAWCCRGTEDLGPQYFEAGIGSGSRASSSGKWRRTISWTQCSVIAWERYRLGSPKICSIGPLEYHRLGILGPHRLESTPHVRSGSLDRYNPGSSVDHYHPESSEHQHGLEVAATQLPGAAGTSLRAIAGACG